MLWRQWRREVTHCELFASIQALLAATKDFFDRYRPPAAAGALHPGRTPHDSCDVLSTT
jgi:hypothetical protein